MIDATARLEHYLEHLAPTWLALPADARGSFFVPSKLLDHATALGVEATAYEGGQPPFDESADPVLVAATQDLRRARAARRPIAYQGHGVGQSFVNADGSRRKGYSGGEGFEGVSLFLAVNDRHAALWRDAYPGAEVEVVGAPKLGGRFREAGPRGDLVVVSFHWRAGIGIPEATTAIGHYGRAIRPLARHFRVAMHSHPRIRREARTLAAAAGVPFIEHFDEVLDTAAVYVNDASSTLYEFAAFGGPVVVLNAPAFRRDVEHGLRFWDCADVGVQVDRPGDLETAVSVALDDLPAIARRRREISAELYPYDDPAERAAAAVLRLAGRSTGSLTGALEAAR
jgi:hypothetical protein